MTDEHQDDARQPEPLPVLPPLAARILAWLGSAVQGVLRSTPVAALPGRTARPRGYPVAVRLHDLTRLTRHYPVLVLETGDDTLRLIMAALRSAGLTALGVQRAELALRLCRTLPISLLISDFLRRDTNGLFLRQEMLADRDLRRIPFILIAYNIPSELDDRTLSYGVLTLLTFPLSREIVEHAAREALLAHGNWRMPRGFQPDLYDQMRAPGASSFMVGRQRVLVVRPGH
jgi:hypothetical protein